MRFNRTNQVLIGLLLLQTLLAIVVFFPREEETVAAGALLPDYTSSAVDRLTISTDTDQTINLAQNEAGEWVLPDYDDFPADPARITTLLDKFTGLQANRLITRSETSHRRLQVADDEFLRKIEFQADGETQILYLGVSGGGNATHARLNDEAEVYLVSGLAPTDANGAITSWINATYFNVPVAEVVEVTLENANGTFNFVKNGETWVLSDLSDTETFAPDQFTTFLNQATNIRLSEPLSRTVDEEWAMDAPVVTLTIRTETPIAEPVSEATAEATMEASVESTAEANPEPVQMEEKTFTVQMGAALENGVVVKSSESEYYILISQATADNFLNKTRENFLVLPPTPTPSAGN